MRFAPKLLVFLKEAVYLQCPIIKLASVARYLVSIFYACSPANILAVLYPRAVKLMLTLPTWCRTTGKAKPFLFALMPKMSY